MGARAHLAAGLAVDFPSEFPALSGFPSPGRLVAIAQALKGYDLILTYNWGAMDVVMAHSVFGKTFNLPPLIHHEDGFNEDEVEQLKSKRNWFRRIALSRTSHLVVPSKVLETIARTAWHFPADRLIRIPNGIDTEAFGKSPRPGALRVVKREGERWVGTLAGLRPVKQLPMLVRAFAHLPENWQLVIMGDGPERDAIRDVATELEVAHRVHLPGAIANPAEVIGMFDIFALSSQSEQFPLSVVEAMAAGLPIAAPDVGDIRNMISPANRPFVSVPNDAAALGAMLEELADAPEQRQVIGAANREKAIGQFDHEAMIARYRKLYSGAMGREF
jgi:glycosyltransferase involved in cell wall biosynthesis